MISPPKLNSLKHLINYSQIKLKALSSFKGRITFSPTVVYLYCQQPKTFYCSCQQQPEIPKSKGHCSSILQNCMTHTSIIIFGQKGEFNSSSTFRTFRVWPACL